MTAPLVSERTCLCDLTDNARQALTRLVQMKQRWFVAYQVDNTLQCFLRTKNAAGLAEWQSRQWQQFVAPPTIVDVTDSLHDLFRPHLWPETFTPWSRLVFLPPDKLAFRNVPLPRYYDSSVGLLPGDYDLRIDQQHLWEMIIPDALNGVNDAIAQKTDQ